MKVFWIILTCYGFVCFLWAIYAVYKNMTSYSIRPNWWLNVITFFLNLITFPYVLYYAKNIINYEKQENGKFYG